MSLVSEGVQTCWVMAPAAPRAWPPACAVVTRRRSSPSERTKRWWRWPIRLRRMEEWRKGGCGVVWKAGPGEEGATVSERALSAQPQLATVLASAAKQGCPYGKGLQTSANWLNGPLMKRNGQLRLARTCCHFTAGYGVVSLGRLIQGQHSLFMDICCWLGTPLILELNLFSPLKSMYLYRGHCIC